MTAPRYKAVFVDLDGTLVTHRHAIGDRDRQAVVAARQAGISVYINTGRSVPGAVRAFEALLPDAPVFCFNGAVIHDPVRGEDLVRHDLPQATLDEAARTAQESGAALFLFVGDTVITHECDDPAFERLAGLMERMGVERLPTPADLPRAGVTKLWLVSAEAEATELAERTTGPSTAWVRPELGRVFEGLDRVLSSATAMPGMKRGPLEWIAERDGIELSQMVAVGDHDNDLEALHAAGLAVAVDASTRGILKAADRIIGGPGSGGFADLLVELAADRL